MTGGLLWFSAGAAGSGEVSNFLVMDTTSGFADARVMPYQPASAMVFTTDDAFIVGVFPGRIARGSWTWEGPPRLWWTPRSGSLSSQSVDLPGPPVAATLSGGTGHVVLALDDGRAVTVDLSTGELRTVAPAQSEQWVAGASADSVGILIDTAGQALVVPYDGRAVRRLDSGAGTVTPGARLVLTRDARHGLLQFAVRDSNDGTQVVSFTLDGDFNPTPGTILTLTASQFRSVHLSPTGSWWAATLIDGAGRTVTTVQLGTELGGPSVEVSGRVADISDDGQRLLTVGPAGATAVWDVNGSTVERAGPPFEVVITERSALSRLGETTAGALLGEEAVTYGTALARWRIERSSPIEVSIEPLGGRTANVVPHDRGGHIVVAKDDEVFGTDDRAVWERPDGSQADLLPRNEIRGLLSVSTDATLALISTADGVVARDVPAGTTHPVDIGGPVTAAVGIGRRTVLVATAGALHRIAVDASGTVNAQHVADIDDVVTALAVADNADLVAWATEVGSIAVMSPDGSTIRRLAPAVGSTSMLRFADSGRLLIAVGELDEIRIYDVASGIVILSVASERSAGQDGVALRPLLLDARIDGTTLRVLRRAPSTMEIGHLTTYDLDPETALERACAAAARTLTPTEWEQFRPGEPYEPACT
jgi:hypothetical protein